MTLTDKLLEEKEQPDKLKIKKSQEKLLINIHLVKIQDKGRKKVIYG